MGLSPTGPVVAAIASDERSGRELLPAVLRLERPISQGLGQDRALVVEAVTRLASGRSALGNIAMRIHPRLAERM